MKNLIKAMHKGVAITTLLAVIVVFVGCPIPGTNPGGPGGGGSDGGGDSFGGGPGYSPGGPGSSKKDVYLLDMRNTASFTNLQGQEIQNDWNYLILGEDRPTMLVQASAAGLPELIYLKTEDSDIDVLLSFDEDGLPDTLAANDFTFYFFNFDEYQFDMAVVDPNGDIEFHYGIETDTAWDTFGAFTKPEGQPSANYSMSLGRSAASRAIDTDDVEFALAVADKALAIATCVASLFFPLFLVGCIVAAGSALIEVTTYALDETGVLEDVGAGLSIDFLNGMIDSIGCAEVATGNLLGGVPDCVSLFIGAASAALTVNGMLNEEKKTTVGTVLGHRNKPKNNPKPVEQQNFYVNFSANGGEGTVPAELLVKGGSYIALPTLTYNNGAATLYKSGYKFIGWSVSTKATATTVYPAGLIYPDAISNNKTFYAKWSSLRTAEPTNVSAASIEDSIKISWDRVEGAKWYTVYRAECNPYSGAPGGLQYHASVNQMSAPSYTDNNLPDKTKYYYAVTAHNTYGESGAVGVFASTVGAVSGMVYVPGGSFEMGRDASRYDRSYDVTPVHTVTLSSFYIGVYEVTQKQWQDVMGSLPSSLTTGTNYGRGDNYPVYYVSWYKAIEFCNRLSIAEGLSPAYRISYSTDPDIWAMYPWNTTDGKATWDAVDIIAGSTGYRLPTEAQWEYAAKGGDPTAAGWVHYSYAGSNTSGDVAWHRDNSGSRNHEVGTKKANGLGTYDMSGNVSEWCWDWPRTYTNEAQTDPLGASSGTNRVLRGGDWYSVSRNGLSQWRYYSEANQPNYGSAYVGFRLVRPAN